MRIQQAVPDECAGAGGSGEAAATPAALGPAVARLARALGEGDLLIVASDEQRAEEVAAALAIAVPGSEVIHCPSSDALPGDSAPASPASAGRRVAALRRLRLALQSDPRGNIALVSTAEAAARALPPPDAFEAAPPALESGTAIDVADFGARLLEIGYFADDRVDEPGDMAIRGQVIDLFPADAPLPIRIEIAEGQVTSTAS